MIPGGTDPDDRIGRRWIDPVIIGLMTIGVAGAIATWATARETKEATVRIETKFDTKVEDHEVRIRASEVSVVKIGNDVAWIRQFLEDNRKTIQGGRTP